MNTETIQRTNNLYKDRLRSLKSVDELVASVIESLKVYNATGSTDSSTSACDAVIDFIVFFQ